MSLEQQLYLLQQAQEQIKQQIVNHSQAPLINEQNGVLQEMPASQAGQPASVHPTEGCYSNDTAGVQQPQKQFQQQINDSGKQSPSSWLTPLNNEQNGVQPTDDCEQNNPPSFSSNNASQQMQNYNVMVRNFTFFTLFLIITHINCLFWHKYLLFAKINIALNQGV